MKQLAFVLLLLVGGAIAALDFFWKSPTTIATSELQALIYESDPAVIEEGLKQRFQANAAQAQRIRQWIQIQQPIRGLALKKNGHGFTIMPDQASHYVVIRGKDGLGYLAVNIVEERSPHSALMIVHDELGKRTTPVPGTSTSQ